MARTSASSVEPCQSDNGDLEVIRESPRITSVQLGTIEVRKRVAFWPAAAEFQLPRTARERGTTVEQLRALVTKHTEGRELGVVGEARVNVLELNLDLERRFPVNEQGQAQ